MQSGVFRLTQVASGFQKKSCGRGDVGTYISPVRAADGYISPTAPKIGRIPHQRGRRDLLNLRQPLVHGATVRLFCGVVRTS